MKNKSFLYFGLGALVGSVITFFVTKTIMDKEYNEREKGVESLFERKRKELEDKCSELEQYKPVTLEETTETAEAPEEENKEESNMANTVKHDEPFLIGVDDYGNNGYDTKQIYLYTDGVITLGDDLKIDIKDAYDLLGKENLRDLAVSEEPAIYIRNDNELTDYRVESLSYDYYDDEEPEE